MARLIFLTLTRIIIQGGLTSTLSVSGVAGLMGDRMNQSGCGWLQTSQKVKTKGRPTWQVELPKRVQAHFAVYTITNLFGLVIIII